jgi:hypothetical protein
MGVQGIRYKVKDDDLVKSLISPPLAGGDEGEGVCKWLFFLSRRRESVS